MKPTENNQFSCCLIKDDRSMFFGPSKKILEIDAKIDRLLAKSEGLSREYVTVNRTHFKVAPHWFWDEFSRERWEPHTYDIMRKCLTPKSCYVDIGTWVGPTVFYAAELGVKKIFGVEANPLTYRLLKETISFNDILSEVKLTNVCISDQDSGFVSFGGKSGKDTSSASSIRGEDWSVPSTTLMMYLHENDIENCDFIKIDIEGAETLIMKDLEYLSKRPGLTVLLSLHPPMWTDTEKEGERIVESLHRYSVAQSNGAPLTLAHLRERIATSETYPSWGTPFGNFFEIILRTR